MFFNRRAAEIAEFFSPRHSGQASNVSAVPESSANVPRISLIERVFSGDYVVQILRVIAYAIIFIAVLVLITITVEFAEKVILLATRSERAQKFDSVISKMSPNFSIRLIHALRDIYVKDGKERVERDLEKLRWFIDTKEMKELLFGRIKSENLRQRHMTYISDIDLDKADSGNLDKIKSVALILKQEGHIIFRDDIQMGEVSKEFQEFANRLLEKL